MIKDFDIKPVLTTIKNPKNIALLERVNQLILNMLVIKYHVNKVFDYIDTWDETIESISWEIRASYNQTTKATTGQAVCGIYMIFNLTSVIDW